MTRPPDAPATAAVVVTHETRDEAIACVATLADAGAEEIVVVDTGSTDGTLEAMREHHPDVDVVATGNVGYGRAANIGVERTSAPVVVVANADTRFAPGAVTALAAAIGADPGVGLAGPLVRYPDGRLQASARRLPTLGQAVAHGLLGRAWPSNPASRTYLRTDADPDEEADVDWVSGCALAVRRDAFDEIGGFDPRYALFVEDVDLCYRARAAGWRVRYVPAAEVVHEVGASRRGRPARMLVEHARSLDRFYGVAYDHGVGRPLRPLLRAGLAAWTAAGVAAGAAARLRRGKDEEVER